MRPAPTGRTATRHRASCPPRRSTLHRMIPHHALWGPARDADSPSSERPRHALKPPHLRGSGQVAGHSFPQRCFRPLRFLFGSTHLSGAVFGAPRTWIPVRLPLRTLLAALGASSRSECRLGPSCSAASGWVRRAAEDISVYRWTANLCGYRNSMGVVVSGVSASPDSFSLRQAPRDARHEPGPPSMPHV